MVMIQGESLDQRAGTLPPQPDALVLVDGPDDDNMLMARLRAGDELAFRALVDRHRPWLVRLCTRMLGYDAHAAEDAAQESLLKLHAAAHRGQPLRVRPWLSVVARNACVDEQRRRRPDLPGELPERAVAGEDPFDLDAALSDAWSRLSGRHREVLYLREVLGFSYKEIGETMGLTMAATETLVFRARGALKREYERSGGTSFGSALLGFQLARLGLRRRDAAVTDTVANAAATDPGFSNLTSRLAHFLSTSLPGCGEQAIAKILSVAAGAVVAAASIIPGLNPFTEGPKAGAEPGPAVVSAQLASGGGTSTALAGGSPSTNAVSLKSLLGTAIPADWTPQRSRSDASRGEVSGSAAPASSTPSSRITPVRDAATAVRSPDRPGLNRPVRGGTDEGPLRSILPARPGKVDRPERPHRLRSLLADPVPVLIDPLPIEEPPIDVGTVDPQPSDPVPAPPTPTEPAPAPPTPTEPAPVDPIPGENTQRPGGDSPPQMGDEVQQGKDALTPGDDNVGGHDPALLRRRDG